MERKSVGKKCRVCFMDNEKIFTAFPDGLEAINKKLNRIDGR